MRRNVIGQISLFLPGNQYELSSFVGVCYFQAFVGSIVVFVIHVFWLLYPENYKMCWYRLDVEVDELPICSLYYWLQIPT